MSFVELTTMVEAVLVVLLMAALVFSMRRRRGDLARRGQGGTAVIVSVQKTQEKVGNLPVANVSLDVTPDVGPGFQAIAKQVISPSNSYLFEPGRQVPIRYDRSNRSNIIIVTDN